QVIIASLSIGDMPSNTTTYTVNPYRNGNQTAKVNNLPLVAYLKSIYSGYKVKYRQMDKINVSISGEVLNNPLAIMTYLSKTYGIAFNIDQKAKLIIVEPSNNVSYQSYKDGLYQLNQERADYNQQPKFVVVPKTEVEENSTSNPK
ncbi:MAG: hypothetical protein ACJA0H_001204, partial [Francisellaceae bacterium]